MLPPQGSLRLILRPISLSASFVSFTVEITTSNGLIIWLISCLGAASPVLSPTQLLVQCPSYGECSINVLSHYNHWAPPKQAASCLSPRKPHKSDLIPTFPLTQALGKLSKFKGFGNIEQTVLDLPSNSRTFRSLPLTTTEKIYII